MDRGEYIACDCDSALSLMIYCSQKERTSQGLVDDFHNSSKGGFTRLTRLTPSCSILCVSVLFLLSLLSLGVSSQPITDGQRLFSIAVSRVQHLHLLAQRLFSDFVSRRHLAATNKTRGHTNTLGLNVSCCVWNVVCFVSQESSLQTEEQRQLNKIFLQDFCNSDYIISPIDKHETQRSSVRVAHNTHFWVTHNSAHQAGGQRGCVSAPDTVIKTPFNVVSIVHWHCAAYQEAVWAFATSSRGRYFYQLS